MNCIIIDSNKADCTLLSEYISEEQGLNLTGIFADIFIAAKAMAEHKPDLVFIEAGQMGGISGFASRSGSGQRIIITSASPAHALEAFDLGAVDYLLKPFLKERFLKAIAKAKSEKVMMDAEPPHESDAEYFFVKADNKFEKIHRKDILYIEGLQNYITIQTATKKVVTYSSLKSIENYLSEKEFLRVQKSFIVSISKIDSIDSDDVIIGKTIIPISRSIKETVLKTILSNRLYKYQC